jgi:YD repeat-containing protein
VWLAYVIFATACAAQIPSETDTTSTPVPHAGHDYIQGMSETVNPANGSLSIRIGVPMPPGRGLTVPFSFAYDSNGSVYLGTPLCPGCSVPPSGVHWLTTNAILSSGGWSYSVPMLSVQNDTYAVQYTLPNEQEGTFVCQGRDNFVMQDENGNRRNLGLAYYDANSQCSSNNDGAGTSNNVLTALYGSLLSTTTGTWEGTLSNAPWKVNPVTVTDGDGKSYYFGPAQAPGTQTFCGSTACTATTYPASSISDRNGNTLGITFSTSSEGTPNIAYTDSIGRPVLSIPTFGASPDNIAVYGFSSGFQVNWTTVTPNFSITMTAAPVSSNQSCAAPGAQPSVPAVSSITLPNGQSYTFDYSNNPYGMVDKITYPTGGYVRYVWGLNSQSEYGQWDIVTSQEVNGTPVPVVTGFCAYYYDTPAVLQRFVSFDGVHEVLEQAFQYYPLTVWGTGSNGIGPNQWTQKTTTVTTMDLSRNTQYQTTYTYGPVYADIQPGFHITNPPPQIPVESQILYYDTNGALLETVNKQWGNERIIKQQQTVLANGQTSETDWQYYPTTSFYSSTALADVNYEPTTEMEQYRYDYDYGSGGRGTLLRETYIPSYDSSFTFAQNILDKPNSVEVLGGGGNFLAERAYSYDGNGNLKSRSDWLNSSGSQVLTTSHNYDAYGNMISTSDPAGNTANYSYTNNFIDTCSYTPVTSAYLTQITYPPTAKFSGPDTAAFQYHCATGELANSTDENKQPTTYQYNDPLNRLTQVQGPSESYGTPTTGYTYNDSSPNPSVTTTVSQTPNPSKTTVEVFDGIGQTVQTRLTTDPSGAEFVDTAYDGNSRVYQQSNPTRCSSSPGAMPGSCAESTWGITTFYYDASGRPVAQVHPDGSALAWCYNGVASTMPAGVSGKCNSRLGSVTTGTWVDSADEFGNDWQRTSDGLERMTEVMEPNGTSPSPPSMETDYAYDGNANLLSVLQKGNGSGSVGRSFNYDSLSRLISAINPETGTVGYSYTANNALCSGDPSQPCGKTDARGITVNYFYDARNRLTAKTYSNDSKSLTPWSCYEYDVTANPQANSTGNFVGRLTNEWTLPAGTSCGAAPPSSGSLTLRSILGYDPTGHLLSEQQCTPASCPPSNPAPYALQYQYDLAGNLTYSSSGLNAIPGTSTPLAFTSAFDGASHLQAVGSSWTPTSTGVPNPACVFAAQTATSSSTPACTQATTSPYAAFGGLTGAIYGNGAVTQNRTFDPRLRVNGESDVGGTVGSGGTAASATITITGAEQPQ